MERTGGCLRLPQVSISMCFWWGNEYYKEIMEHGNKAVRNLKHIGLVGTKQGLTTRP